MDFGRETTECFSGGEKRIQVREDVTESTSAARFHYTVSALPDPSGVGPVSGHEGRSEQRRHGLVKQEVILMWRSVKQ